VFAMSKMFASYSVDDINAARQFYGELGLKVTAASDERGPLWLHFAGDQEILLYPKADHVHGPESLGDRRRGSRRRARRSWCADDQIRGL